MQKQKMKWWKIQILRNQSDFFRFKFKKSPESLNETIFFFHQNVISASCSSSTENKSILYSKLRVEISKKTEDIKNLCALN